MRRVAVGISLIFPLAVGSNLPGGEERAAQKQLEGVAKSKAANPPLRKWTGPKRSWGPEQAVGEPDTPGAGDLTTAWASATPDDQAEWLICEFEKPLQAIFLRVHETYNPGALVKVTAFGADGKEVTAWEGEDPTARGEQRGVSKIPIALGADVQRFKLYIDSPAVRGWNEIDAVAAEDETGKLHWAVAVQASSTFAGDVAEMERPIRIVVAPPSPFEILQQEVADLKKREEKQSEEIRALRNELRELRDSMKKSKRDP
jgi:hypothetical protein